MVVEVGRWKRVEVEGRGEVGVVRFAIGVLLGGLVLRTKSEILYLVCDTGGARLAWLI